MAPKSIVALNGSAVKIENQVFCGTCGWHAPNDPCFDNLDQKFFDIRNATPSKFSGRSDKTRPGTRYPCSTSLPTIYQSGKENDLF